MWRSNYKNQAKFLLIFYKKRLFNGKKTLAGEDFTSNMRKSCPKCLMMLWEMGKNLTSRPFDASFRKWSLQTWRFLCLLDILIDSRIEISIFLNFWRKKTHLRAHLLVCMEPCPLVQVSFILNLTNWCLGEEDIGKYIDSGKLEGHLNPHFLLWSG